MARGNYRKRTYLSSIQHENLIHYRFVVGSSQATLTIIIEIYEANFSVKKNKKIYGSGVLFWMIER